jgi:hypothetical protein
VHLQPHSKELESGTVLGAPDIVVLALTEFAEQIHHITRASSLSLMFDADHSYSNALNMMQPLEELEATGDPPSPWIYRHGRRRCHVNLPPGHSKG